MFTAKWLDNRPIYLYRLLSLLGLFIFPVLYLQGKLVRRRVPVLPHADGPVHGESRSQSVQVQILLVGDSTAAGVGARSHRVALIGRLADSLDALMDAAVAWHVCGQSGAKIAHLEQQFLAQTSHRRADVVVVCVGVNDVVGGTRGHRWIAELGAFEKSLDNQLNDVPIVFCGLPPMGHFPALPSPLRNLLAWRAKYLNALLMKWCKEHERRWYFPLPISAQADMMAADGFHPSEHSYQLWAEALAAWIATEILTATDA